MICVKKSVIERIHHINGALRLPGDKSISHRAVILGALAQGKTRIVNFCTGDDTARTIQALQALGISIEGSGTEFVVWGKGLTGLLEPQDVLYTGNSGTTTRLLTGLLSGQPFFSVLTGDASLRSRPMKRVSSPLRMMGARIDGRGDGNYAPLTIRGGNLSPIEYELPVASAQVKSALLLAGLYADGTSRIIESAATRDHTERMLQAMGASIERKNGTVAINGFPELAPLELYVPGDISSAAFFIVAASIVPGSEIVIYDVGMNPSRTGVLDILRQMGANIGIRQAQEAGGEPRADLVVRSAELHAVTIEGDMIPRAIDELPVLAVAAAYAEGTTIIRNAQELRVKETDRISAMAAGLKAMGADVEEFPDGLSIIGREELEGATVSSCGDHRIAMAFTIAGLGAAGKTTIEDAEAVGISYPEFFNSLRSLSV